MDTLHPVHEENQKIREGDELETPLGHMIETQRRPAAASTDRRSAMPRSDAHLDGLLAETKWACG